MRRLILIIMIALCLGACTPGHNDYSDFKNIKSQGWAYCDTLRFIPETDSVSHGSLTLALRHNNNYLYSNLWLEVGYHKVNGSIERDTVNIILADVYGRWQGSGIGSYFQTETVLDRNYTFNDVDSVSVRHIMRCDTLDGITQVGLLFISDREQ